jgi:YD repeat-containing protein
MQSIRTFIYPVRDIALLVDAPLTNRPEQRQLQYDGASRLHARRRTRRESRARPS